MYAKLRCISMDDPRMVFSLNYAMMANGNGGQM
jgi:hypothetical protein